MKTYEILLLHEDPWLLNAIAFGLESIGCRLDAVCNTQGAIELIDIEAEGNKYHVTKVSDALAAADTLKTRHFDLVIADANAPSESNLAVVRKKGESRVGTAAMIRLADRYSDPEARVSPLLADDYLLVPFTPTEFWNKIRDCLDSGPS